MAEKLGSSGSITINGGTVSAFGGSGGAGIGGGSTTYSSGGSGLNITINGGTVTAHGGMGAAGIGGGSSGSGIGITINGGTVTATGMNQGAGIGGGSFGIASNVVINAGNVIANGGGSGIGSGDPYPASKEIYIYDKLKLKVGDSAPPTSVIEHDTMQDLSESLKGRRYVTIEQPTWVSVKIESVSGASGELYYQGNPIAGNEVPSNAVVRVIYTAIDGKAFNGGSYLWQADCLATNSEQTATHPEETIDWNGTMAETSVRIDTRDTKRYFDTSDIPPIWHDKDSTVSVTRNGTSTKETIAYKANSANTISWIPEIHGVYDFTHDRGSLCGRVMYAIPVELNTNGLSLANTVYKIYADGTEIKTDGEGKHIVAQGSLVTTIYSVTNECHYFADGTKTTVGGPVVADKLINNLAETAARVSMKTGEPTIQLGVVAQRYPWNGIVDIQYRTMFWPKVGYSAVIDIETDAARDTIKLDLSHLQGSMVGMTNYNMSAIAPDVRCKVRVKAKVIHDNQP